MTSHPAELCLALTPFALVQILGSIIHAKRHLLLWIPWAGNHCLVPRSRAFVWHGTPAGCARFSMRERMRKPHDFLCNALQGGPPPADGVSRLTSATSCLPSYWRMCSHRLRKHVPPRTLRWSAGMVFCSLFTFLFLTSFYGIWSQSSCFSSLRGISLLHGMWLFSFLTSWLWSSLYCCCHETRTVCLAPFPKPPRSGLSFPLNFVSLFTGAVHLGS